MPKPRTLQRRAQRKRARARFLVSPEYRATLAKANEVLKSIYLPSLTALFNQDNPLYRMLKKEDANAFAVGSSFNIPLHRG